MPTRRPLLGFSTLRTLEVFCTRLSTRPYNNKGEEELSEGEEAGRKGERPASLLRPCSQSANCHRCAQLERAKVCDLGAWKENEERARPLPFGAAPREGRGSLHHDMPHNQ